MQLGSNVGAPRYDWLEELTLHQWTDPESNSVVPYHAMRILPRGSSIDRAPSKGLPLAVYFPGLGENVSIIMKMKDAWAKIAPEPFFIVAPVIPPSMWWFIDDDGKFGWIQGKFTPDVVARFCGWLAFLAGCPVVDKSRIGLFGFSAGAYAVVEMFSHHGCIPLSGIGLGGAHGHGQRDLAGVPVEKAQSAVMKFEAFLQRIKNHRGVPWIEATHGRTDQESKFTDAQEIIQCLNEQQVALGLPKVSVRELAAEEQDIKPTEWKNKTHHSYFYAAFYRKEFLVALLGGPSPVRPAPAAPAASQRLCFEGLACFAALKEMIN
jgi:hypothetical protein